VLGAGALMAQFVWDTIFSPMGGAGIALMALIVALLAADVIARRDKASQQSTPDGGTNPGVVASLASGDGAQGSAEAASGQA
jgi:hypothetical protein